MPSSPKTILNRVVKNALVQRQSLLRKLFDTRKDIEHECGHPENLTITEYENLYERNDIATRVVSLYPEECWSDDPIVFETEDANETAFEREWKRLVKTKMIFPFLQRADVLSGIGSFGVLLLGLDDGEPLDKPVEGIDETGKKVGNAKRNLVFLRPFSESLVTVNSLETDITNPRYGLPRYYSIQFSETALGVPPRDSDQKTTNQLRVHWSRVIHLADNRTNSEVWGQPRMKKVFNRLLDLRKIAGGSGEMFWKGGFPGYSLESVPGLEEDIEFDETATRKQMEDYMNGLQRYIATVGMQVKSLSVQIADPNPHALMQLKLIASAMGVPWRVFIGSEAAQLASEQDTKSWNRRLNRRRLDYLTPFVLSPFIDRLIALGVLPEPTEYTIHWPDLNSPSDEDKASVAEKRTNAMAKYVQSGSDQLMTPFHFLTLVLGMSEDEANSIIEAAEEQILQVDGNGDEDDNDANPNPDEDEDEDDEDNQ